MEKYYDVLSSSFDSKLTLEEVDFFINPLLAKYNVTQLNFVCYCADIDTVVADFISRAKKYSSIQLVQHPIHDGYHITLVHFSSHSAFEKCMKRDIRKLMYIYNCNICVY